MSVLTFQVDGDPNRKFTVEPSIQMVPADYTTKITAATDVRIHYGTSITSITRLDSNVDEAGRPFNVTYLQDTSVAAGKVKSRCQYHTDGDYFQWVTMQTVPPLPADTDQTTRNFSNHWTPEAVVATT